jgi:hypothetical protein
MTLNRTFLTLALAASGLAQPPPDARAEFRRRTAPLIGSHYLRPPNPRVEDFDRDLALMRKTGPQVAKVWVYWTTVNPKPGVWVWDVYDRFFDAPERQGLRVLLRPARDLRDLPPEGITRSAHSRVVRP